MAENTRTIFSVFQDATTATEWIAIPDGEGSISAVGPTPDAALYRLVAEVLPLVYQIEAFERETEIRKTHRRITMAEGRAGGFAVRVPVSAVPDAVFEKVPQLRDLVDDNFVTLQLAPAADCLSKVHDGKVCCPLPAHLHFFPEEAWIPRDGTAVPVPQPKAATTAPPEPAPPRPQYPRAITLTEAVIGGIDVLIPAHLIPAAWARDFTVVEGRTRIPAQGHHACPSGPVGAAVCVPDVKDRFHLHIPIAQVLVEAPLPAPDPAPAPPSTPGQPMRHPDAVSLAEAGFYD